MNKSTLISTINGFITAIITQLKVRNSLLELINTLFQTTTTQTLTTGSNVFWYNLRYKKIGNIVYIDGYITNKYSVIKSATNLLTIPNALYYAKTGQDTFVNQKPLISASSTTLYLIDAIAPNETIYINAHYQTND